jgi:hypothetical protein
MDGGFAFEISRYRDKGYEIPKIRRIMTARLFVRSHRKGMSSRAGKRWSMT